MEADSKEKLIFLLNSKGQLTSYDGSKKRDSEKWEYYDEIKLPYDTKNLGNKGGYPDAYTGEDNPSRGFFERIVASIFRSGSGSTEKCQN